MENILGQVGELKGMQFLNQYTIFVTLLGLVVTCLIAIVRLLWQMKLDADRRGERQNDSVNCLGRIEVLLRNS